MKKQEREKAAITNPYGNIKNKFRNAKLINFKGIDVFYVRPNVRASTVKPLESVTVFCHRTLWPMLRVAVNMYNIALNRNTAW
jgi:hypothetical protein